MMIRIANATGLITSRAAWRMTWVLFTTLPTWCESSRKLFSTITTAPSTIIPIATAKPASDIRFEDRPHCCIMMKAISMASGRAVITTTAERTSPKKRNRMIATRIEPSISALTAVCTALSTRSVRSYTGLMVTPLGSACWTICSFFLTASTTFLAFSPMRCNAMPSTTSLPSLVTAPKRKDGASLTSATSRTYTGVPARPARTTLPISRTLPTKPRPRTRYCSWPMLRY